MLPMYKKVLQDVLPSKSLDYLRVLKRALKGELQLPESEEPQTQLARGLPGPQETPDKRILQEIALEKYAANKIYAPYLFYDEEDVLKLPVKELARALTLSVQYINSSHVNGDIAEFGTMGGFTARSIAVAMVFDPRRQPITDATAGENPFRKLRLFDSFEGLPEITSAVDLVSPHVVSGSWSKGGCKVLSAPELRTMIERILPPERIQIIEGWFADTIKTLPSDTRFAMIHFDGDLYQSTMDALTPCFARGFVSTGAMLCFDDWNANRAIPSCGERQAWTELVERFKIVFSHCGDYSIGGTKFIIHSYQGMPSQV